MTVEGLTMTRTQIDAIDNAMATECARLRGEAATIRGYACGPAPEADRKEQEASLLWRAWRVQRLALLGRPEESRALALTLAR